jgi:hypothetical protein
VSSAVPDPVARGDAACSDLAEWRDMLRHLQDPAAIGALMAMFAHAANNRLTVILSCLDVLGSEGLAATDARAALELAHGASTDLTRELAALQAAMHRNEPERSRIELRDATRAGVRWHETLGAAIAVEVDVPVGLQVVAEPGVPSLAVLRLLALAQRCEASAVRIHGDMIEFTSRPRDRSALRPGRYARLQFTCSHMRLTPSLLDTRVGPGQGLDRLHDPHGLEFAAVEASAAALRGQLLAHSTPDGDRFELYLPLAAAT